MLMKSWLKMSKILHILRKVSFKDIAILSSGVLIAQIIGILCQPITTRIYGEVIIGQIALYTATLTMLLPILTMQYDICIVAAQSDEDADTLTALSIYLGMFISVIISISIIIYDIFQPNAFREIGGYIYTYIFLFTLTVITSVATNLNNRHKQYKLISKVSIISASTSGVVKIGMGFLGFGFIGLLLSEFMSLIIGFRMKSKYIFENFRTIFSKKPDVLLKCAKRYKNQPLYSVPGNFIVAFAYSILAFIISQLYGVNELGFYSLSITMLGLPFGLVSESISRVFYKNASIEFNNTRTIKDSFENASVLLFIVAIPIFVVIYIFAEPAFAFVFGSVWIRSGTFVKILVPLFFVRFLTSGLITGLIIIEKQLAKMLLQALFLISVGVSWLLTSQLSLSIETFLSVISYSYAAVYVVIYLFLLRESRTYSRS